MPRIAKPQFGAFSFGASRADPRSPACGLVEIGLKPACNPAPRAGQGHAADEQAEMA
ncbi:hypothetical protein chiPu_0029678, partial [Chiloscyllium punctatum]|nr:hypothetical protein [Chiloscyllium punctatum]